MQEDSGRGIGPVDAALFDFDGTLVDSESLWLDLIGDVLAEAGTPTVRASAFRGLSSTEAKVWLARSGADVSDLDRRYSEMLAAVSTSIPQAAEFLARLDAAQIPCAVATNGRRVDVAGIIERTGLNRHLGAVATVEDVERGKPHPELYLHAATLLRVPPARAVVFEDSEAGAAAGRAAGCFVVGINEDDSVLIDAHLRVSSFADLVFDPDSRTISTRRSA